MESYDSLNKKFGKIVSKQKTWNAIEPENATRMTIQNRFQSGIEIAKVSLLPFFFSIQDIKHFLNFVFFSESARNSASFV